MNNLDIYYYLNYKSSIKYLHKYFTINEIILSSGIVPPYSYKLLS